MFFNKKKEVKKLDVLEILPASEYHVRFGKDCIGIIKMANNEWIFIPASFSGHAFTVDEMYQIYTRLNQLNCDL